MANISVDGALIGGVLTILSNEIATTASTMSATVPSLITSTAAQAYILPAPALGLTKMVLKTSSSTAVQTISSTLGGVAATLGIGHTLTFTGSDQAVVLVGLSSTAWQVLINSGGMAIT
jgi:hypothetical protein